MTTVIDTTIDTDSDDTDSNGIPAVEEKPKRRPRTTTPPSVISGLAADMLALRNAASMRRGELIRELKEIDEAFGFTEAVPAPVVAKAKAKPVAKARAEKPVVRRARVAADADFVELVLSAVRKCGNNGASIGAIVSTVAAPKEDVAKALKMAVKAGALSTTGKNRGLKYLAV